MRPAEPILHVDLDAFYAGVEVLKDPSLKGKPVIVGGTGARGVVASASYEARAFGVHSAMGLMKAAALAPDAILLPVDFDAYRKYSRLFKAAVATIAPQIQDNGIDALGRLMPASSADRDRAPAQLRIAKQLD